MKRQKLYTELETVQEFINFYNGASRRELNARLKSIGQKKKNERKAIQTLLA